jgi:hypothetical protein
VFEMARCEGSQPATQTLVLAMQFSRSAPRPVRLEAAVRARGAELDGGARPFCRRRDTTDGVHSFKTEQ